MSQPPSGHRRPRPRLTVPLTAMIDVVFLLLVYFMVATDFTANEAVYQLDLPPTSIEAAAALTPHEPPLSITVFATESPAASISVGPPWNVAGSCQALASFLNRNRATTLTAAGLFHEDHPIHIIPEDDVTWAHVVDVFDTVARQGFTNVGFAEASP